MKSTVSDEVKVSLHGSDGNYRYWIDKEEIKTNCIIKQAIIPKEKYGFGSIEIWGCFGFCGVGFLRKYDKMNSELYVKVLTNEMMKSVTSVYLKNKEIIGCYFMMELDLIQLESLKIG